MQSAAYHLLMCYQSLRDEAVLRREVLEGSSVTFAQQYAALRDSSEDPKWRLKPKMHLFSHLCSLDSVQDWKHNFDLSPRTCAVIY